MGRASRRGEAGYLVAIAGIALIALVRLAFWRELGDNAPLIPFVIPLIAAGWVGGARPALFATAASALLGLALLLPTHTQPQFVETIDAVRIASFVAFGLAWSGISAQLQRARREIATHAAAVHENEERVRLALDAAKLGSWEWRLDTDEVHWSPEVYALLGLPRGEPPSRALFEARLDPEERERHQRAIDAALATGVYECELRVARPGDPPGAFRIMSARGRVVTDEDGGNPRLLGVSSDVTARKQTEELLREADRRKDEFLAMLAHELRNPLAPIRNAVELQKLHAPSDPEIAWSRDVIDRQVQQMARLLDDLLDVSRISRNKLELRRERVTLAEVIASAIETSQPLIKDAGHGLAVRLPGEPAWLDADPTRLSQVFSNLLNNAAKFMDDGGHISVTAELEGGFVRVHVRDRGMGIAPELLPRVFDAFTQIAPARSRDGLGIGLSLSRSLVALHGGGIEARSAGPGAGSELIVTLPLASAPQAGAAEVLAAPRTETTRRILVADDFEDSAESLALLLRRMGHEVHTASTGAQAIEAARALRPDVALLDIGMPGLDGYEVCRRIRAEAWGAGMRLLAVTGWGQAEDRRRSQAAGFDGHLVKPIDPRALAALLAEPSA